MDHSEYARRSPPTPAHRAEGLAEQSSVQRLTGLAGGPFSFAGGGILRQTAHAAMPTVISTSELVPAPLAKILSDTPELERAYLVGGCVRDWLLGCPTKDCDIEVFGLNYEQLANALTRWGKTDLVGRSFGVIKLTTPRGPTFDFTIPRRDSKVATVHKSFDISSDPSLTH